VRERGGKGGEGKEKGGGGEGKGRRGGEREEGIAPQLQLLDPPLHDDVVKAVTCRVFWVLKCKKIT